MPHESTPTKEDQKRRFTPLKRILPFLAPYKFQIFLAFCALIIASMTVLTFGQGLKYVIDHGFIEEKPETLNHALIFMVGATLLLAFASFSRFYLVSWIGERVVADLRTKVFAHLLTLCIPFYETTKIGDITSRLTTDTTIIQVVVGSSFSVALRNTLLLIGGLILLFLSSVKLTSYIVLIIPCIILPIVLFGRRVRRLSRTSQEKISSVSANGEETLANIRTVQAYTHEDIENTHFVETVEEAFKASMKRVSMRAWLTAVVISFIFGTIAFILWIGGKDVLEGRMSAGELSSFIFYALIVAGSFGSISEVIGDLLRAAGATDRLFDLFKEEPTIKDQPNPVSFPSPLKGDINFNKLTFSYPTREEQTALENFNLSIKSGEHIAIVGPSGAGKSTIFSLLLRFYDPHKGSIAIDGLQINRTSLEDLRHQIALVPQDPVIFSTTAFENIKYGNPNATNEEVFKAAQHANAEEFILKLPNKYNCYLGEKGVRLSGGQKQRIAIARAILKDPAILLLDEATSALDAQNEKLIQKAFAQFSKNRTTLVIAHRLATVKNADRIIVLEHGKIVATGTHTELMKENGLYAKLAEMQFEGI